MKNAVKGEKSVSVEQWINNKGIREGILSIYSNEPFNYEDSRMGYEIGRQIAILAKEAGLATRGSILRKKANSDNMAIVKTKLPILMNIIYKQLMFKVHQLAIETGR
jgi:hypothetical protein